jgi:hypothetical protein
VLAPTARNPAWRRDCVALVPELEYFEAMIFAVARAVDFPAESGAFPEADRHPPGRRH